MLSSVISINSLSISAFLTFSRTTHMVLALAIAGIWMWTMFRMVKYGPLGLFSLATPVFAAYIALYWKLYMPALEPGASAQFALVLWSGTWGCLALQVLAARFDRHAVA